MIEISDNTRCLILGGTGFIGRHVVRALVGRGQNVRVLTRRKQNIFDEPFGIDFDRVEILEGDLTDPQLFPAALEGCDTCIHLAGATIPATSNEGKIFDVQSNLLGTINLLEAARAQGMRRIVYVSSGGAVYGNPVYSPIDESHPTEPRSSYGIVKLAAEKYFQLFEQLYDLKPVVLRMANPYGPGQRIQSNQGAVSVFLDRALSNKPIAIWGDGKIVRDFLYIDDAVLAILAALDYDGNETIFNIGSGVGTDINAIVAAIEALLNRSVEVVYQSSRSLDVKANVLDVTKAGKHLGWRPIVSLPDGIALTFHSMRALG